MEMPPFGKGGSDIIWALPFFGLVVFALATLGFLTALSARRSPTHAGKLAAAGVLLNGLSLLIPLPGGRFSSGSPRYFGWSLTESLNQLLGLFWPNTEFGEHRDCLFHRQADDVCK